MQDIFTVSQEVKGKRTAKGRFRNFMQGGSHCTVEGGEQAEGT
jgi:hypothetical protein